MKKVIISLILVFGIIAGNTQTHLAVRTGTATKNEKTGNFNPPTEDSARLLVTLGYVSVKFHNAPGDYIVGALEKDTYFTREQDSIHVQIYSAYDRLKNIQCYVSFKTSKSFPAYTVFTVFYDKSYNYYLLTPYTAKKTK